MLEPAQSAEHDDLEAVAKRLSQGALSWLKRICDAGFEFIDTVCCRAAYRDALVAEGLVERAGGGWLCRATARGHDLRALLADRKRAELVASCPHPPEDRIAALGAPGAYDCKACGYEHRPSVPERFDSMREPLQIGMVIERTGHRHPGHGKICEIMDTRIRVKWLTKCTWIQRSGEGKTWQRVEHKR